MTTSTLRPDATTSNNGAVTGAGSDADLALRDNDSATYITFETGDSARFTLGDLTLPAGAVIKSVGLRFAIRRSATAGYNPTVRVSLFGGSGGGEWTTAEGTMLITWTTATTVTALSATQAVIAFDGDYAFSDTRIDGATLAINHGNAGGAYVEIVVEEAYVDVTYVELPVVTISEPTGTITATNQPLIRWDNDFDGDGGGQTHYEAKIFNDDQYGAGGFDPDTTPTFFDSQQVASANQYKQFLALALPDDTYRAYVRTAQTVNGEQHWSAWDFEQFVIAVDQPALASFTVTSEDEFARVALDSTIDPLADAVASHVQFQVSYDNGTTWENVRTELGGGLVEVDDDDAASTFDYEGANGAVALYRARAATSVGADFAYSEWQQEESSGWSSDAIWLKHPTEPDLNVRIESR